MTENPSDLASITKRKILPHDLLLCFILKFLGSGLLGVAPITSVHHRTTNNEHIKQSSHALYEKNDFNNTLVTPLIDKSPYFNLAATSRNITVLHGENAFLVCSVMNLGKNFVSWIRHNDINLLSVGKLKYTQDSRYQIFHSELNDTWTLKVTEIFHLN